MICNQIRLLRLAWNVIFVAISLLLGGYGLYYSSLNAKVLRTRGFAVEGTEVHLLQLNNLLHKDNPALLIPTAAYKTKNFSSIYNATPTTEDDLLQQADSHDSPDIVPAVNPADKSDDYPDEADEWQSNFTHSSAVPYMPPTISSPPAEESSTEIHDANWDTSGEKESSEDEEPEKNLQSLINSTIGNGQLEMHQQVVAPNSPTVVNSKLGIIVRQASAGSTDKYCNVSGIKSWESGVVTQLLPVVQKNCSKLIAGSQMEVYKVRQQLKVWKNEESDAQFIQRMSNCSNVVKEFSNNFYVSYEEENFPLAFTFVVYTNARQVVRLLKAIYRPHNLYCIHPDAKQGRAFGQIFHQISKCLDNVFLPSKIVKVYYAHHSIMDAQLSCMKDLLRYPKSRWKYVINICGREVPLKTNREIVSSLKRLNGYSALGDARRITPFWWKERFVHKYTLRNGAMRKTYHKLKQAPYGIIPYKSMNFIATSRQFAFFLLTSKKAIAFRDFLKDVYAPEEHFYASLYALPDAPGGRLKTKGLQVPVVDEFIWLSNQWDKTHQWDRCHGWEVHAMCVLSCYDLQTIFKYRRNAFFFNKYFMERDHTVMDCAEENLVQRNIQEYKTGCVAS